MQERRRIPLSNERRLVNDLIAIARNTPFAPLSRTIDVTQLRTLRQKMRPRLPWQIILMRAYALVAKRHPELRQIYVPLPYPHIYQHHESVCFLTISREAEGKNRLFFARFNQPENRSLAELHTMFDELRTKPIAEIRQLKHQVRFAKLPWLIRQIGWKLLTHWMPRGRAKTMGTFGMSLSGYRETKGWFHLGPCTTILGYDPFCVKGQAHVTLTFDHRILDGKPAVDVLETLREVLHGTILHELRQMSDKYSTKPSSCSSSDHSTSIDNAAILRRTA